MAPLSTVLIRRVAADDTEASASKDEPIMVPLTGTVIASVLGGIALLLFLIYWFWFKKKYKVMKMAEYSDLTLRAKRADGSAKEGTGAAST